MKQIVSVSIHFIFLTFLKMAHMMGLIFLLKSSVALFILYQFVLFVWFKPDL